MNKFIYKIIIIIISLELCIIYFSFDIKIPKIEVIYNIKESDDKMNYENVLLTTEEINDYNKEIAKKTTEIYDIDNYKNFTVEEIKEYILKYEMAKSNKYNNGMLIDKEEIKNILDNRNIDNIKRQEVVKGIIIKRANLRSFPTNIHFYSTKEKNDFDLLQESELLVNTPVIILHESKDKLWNFVISPLYIGWVQKENIAITDKESYDFFIKNNSFGIIIAKELEIENIILDMSVKLPYENNKFYLPSKDSNGYVIKKEVSISKDKINIGYLPYTKENVLSQAFKYENTSYSWGGLDRYVDCSSFIANIYRTFGFIFPRNTSAQNTSIGIIIPLDKKSDKEKLALLNDTEPSILYQTGHTMLYIGQKDNEHLIIHASGQGKVMISVLENSSYIKNINKLVLIKNK